MLGRGREQGAERTWQDGGDDRRGAAGLARRGAEQLLEGVAKSTLRIEPAVVVHRLNGRAILQPVERESELPGPVIAVERHAESPMEVATFRVGYHRQL